MNKQLESLFDLPSAASLEQEPVQDLVPELEETPTESSLFDRVHQALPQVRGLHVGENDVDNIANEAMKTYQEIKELAMSVEPRHSAELLAVAAALLKTALDAKQGKIESKLKTVRLQLQAFKTQQDTIGSPTSMTEAKGQILGDRNQILAAIKKSSPSA